MGNIRAMLCGGMLFSLPVACCEESVADTAYRKLSAECLKYIVDINGLKSADQIDERLEQEHFFLVAKQISDGRLRELELELELQGGKK